MCRLGSSKSSCANEGRSTKGTASCAGSQHDVLGSSSKVGVASFQCVRIDDSTGQLNSIDSIAGQHDLVREDTRKVLLGYMVAEEHAAVESYYVKGKLAAGNMG